MEQIARWWDAAELWIAGLPFVPQVALVLAVMIPLSGGLAWILDRTLVFLLALFQRVKTRVLPSTPDAVNPKES